MKKNNKSEAELLEVIQDLKVQQIELELQNKELVLEKEKAVSAMMRQNDALSKLNQFSFELSQLSPETNLEVLITQRIKEFTGAIFASFSVYEPATKSMVVSHIEIEPGLLEKGLSILGKQIHKMHIPVSDEMYDEITTGIIGMRKTLHEVTFGSVSRPVGAAIQTILNFDRFLGIAYLMNGKLYGTSVMAMSKDQPDPPEEILKDFISMASLSLQRKRADESLRESEEMYQTFINSTEDMAYLKDENFRYVIINKANSDFFGRNQADIIGLTDFDLMDSNSAKYCLESDKSALSENKIFISEETIGGRVYETRKFPVKMKSGILGVGGYIRDITERKKVEAALEESEERYKRITEGLTDYLYTVKVKDGVVLETIHNEACKAVTGYSANDFYKDPYLWINMVIPDERELVANRFGRILKGDNLPPLEHRIICKDGKIRWISDTTIPKFDSNGELISYDGVIKEITGRKVAEEIVRLKNEELTQVNAEKDKFFSIISHDLRSPFNAFLGFTEMMADDLDSLSIAEIQNISVSMRNSASNLFQLLENLLEWSRFQRGLTNFSPVSILLQPKVAECLQPVIESAGKKGIEIVIDIPPSQIVYADENLLGSILRNLAFNAVKFTHKGGSVRISSKPGLTDFVDISVTDTGIGISEEILTNLFRIDEQTSREGTDGEPSTGLGLIICKEFVEKHGGSISVESEEGKGSEFKFSMPVKNIRILKD